MGIIAWSSIGVCALLLLFILARALRDEYKWRRRPRFLTVNEKWAIPVDMFSDKFRVRSPGVNSRVIALFGMIPNPNEEPREFERLAELIGKKKERAPQLPVILYINCEGGTVADEYKIAEIVNTSEASFHVVANYAASAGAALFAAFGSRYMISSGLLILHNPYLNHGLIFRSPRNWQHFYSGLRSIRESAAKRRINIFERAGTLSTWRTLLELDEGASKDECAKALIRYLKRDTYIDPLYAVRLGLADDVIVTRAERKEFLARVSREAHF